ncbi:MAG: DMT family transporter, partial [Rhodobacterales bacterium]
LISTTTIGLIITIPLAAPVFEITTDLTLILWISVLIIFGILRQYADIQAYRYAQAAVIAPISYFRMVLIGVMAFFFFEEIPILTTYIGAFIVIASTIYITNRERIAKNLN